MDSAITARTPEALLTVSGSFPRGGPSFILHQSRMVSRHWRKSVFNGLEVFGALGSLILRIIATNREEYLKGKSKIRIKSVKSYKENVPKLSVWTEYVAEVVDEADDKEDAL